MRKKYNVIVDEEGYVVLIRHTGSPRDFVELDLEDYDFSNGRLGCYVLTSDGLVFNDERYDEYLAEKEAELDKKEADILQLELNSTDYICDKNVESVMGIANRIYNGALVPEIQTITDADALKFVKAMIYSFSESYDEYLPTINRRQMARNGINNLRP